MVWWWHCPPPTLSLGVSSPVEVVFFLWVEYSLCLKDGVLWITIISSVHHLSNSSSILLGQECFQIIIFLNFIFDLCSCYVPRVLEKKASQSSLSLGLHGLWRRGGKVQKNKTVFLHPSIVTTTHQLTPPFSFCPPSTSPFPSFHLNTLTMLCFISRLIVCFVLIIPFLHDVRMLSLLLSL